MHTASRTAVLRPTGCVLLRADYCVDLLRVSSALCTTTGRARPQG
ncbi:MULTISPECIES: hypothetical protein [Streptomyces]|uniref:Uncharacterized protein n=1 Tax=Streptomyces albus (strain ATCC 21838 / DSM 41398 / FERM P-419 / JCM 4703 / NBRC 107858) TaxID=1081613 RepID=A0A0B5EP87_STRA4|nr:hypothetical protein [Streptomyces sp. SCSIO ZS0520]AJE81100.1 hypothetical protein SLNWT_0724 [Streptomyces albus]AOU75414.1 hypothetical protein SLNHY_0723 [Streptomyces albus]